MKKLLSLFFVLSIMLSTQVQASGFGGKALELIPVASDLAEQYQLTDVQKMQMRLILSSSLPEAMSIGIEMLNNRRKLLNTTAGSDDLDIASVEEIAAMQGNLLTELIVWKEVLKHDLRAVLDDEQKQFIDDIVEQISQALASSAVTKAL